MRVSKLGRCISLVAALLLLALLTTPGGSSTPVATLPYAPPASLCRQAPIPVDRLTQVMATPIAGTPVAADLDVTGPLAERGTVDQVQATLVELFACLNAGEPLRAYQLYSDGYLRLIGSRQGGFTAEWIDSLATPDPLDPEDWTVILDIASVRTLADGRVAATVRLEPALVPVPKIFTFVLVLEHGRWLVDDVLDEITFSLP